MIIYPDMYIYIHSHVPHFSIIPSSLGHLQGPRSGLAADLRPGGCHRGQEPGLPNELRCRGAGWGEKGCWNHGKMVVLWELKGSKNMVWMEKLEIESMKHGGTWKYGGFMGFSYDFNGKMIISWD